MRPRKKGMFGGGIYFADTMELANYKTNHRGAVVEASVNVGYALILEKAENNPDKQPLDRLNCGAVKGQGGFGRPWEYCVYDSATVRPLNWRPYP
jgi:hypothetical protein